MGGVGWCRRVDYEEILWLWSQRAAQRALQPPTEIVTVMLLLKKKSGLNNCETSSLVETLLLSTITTRAHIHVHTMRSQRTVHSRQ
ncbi:hypothetical protein LSTR_LSTR005251 [Laodelphax striatellus]|uniref:Uncharacterized protein n=1 Tax=Laodelphax striatellus TaxID=195883 RepID=A0A482X7B2_LAOST|nr:hypothetical protein LSTR_LSTR005251 [Laodelphax striatellus]